MPARTAIRDLDACAELDKIVQAVKWLGVKCVPAFLNPSANDKGTIACRSRGGGLLNYCHREAA